MTAETFPRSRTSPFLWPESGHVVSPANAVHSERNSKVPGNLGILIVETVEARRFDTTACSGEAPIADENESLKEPGREFSRVQHEGK